MKKLLTIGLVASSLLYQTSCKDYLDVNVDPNNPNDAPVELVLPVAILSTASVVGGDYAILGGIWSQYYTQNNGSNQYKNIDAFDLQATTFQFRWQELYAGALNDYRYVKEKAAQEEDWNVYLMATVMEAYTYQVLADLYDKIPFDESLRGSENTSPKYQNGPEVYDGLITRINEALAKPTTQTSRLKAADVVFGGDMRQWVRFANTLKLKIYLRQIYARPEVASAGIQALYDAGSQFLNTSANVAIFTDATSRRNPLFEQDQSPALNTNQNLRASNTLFYFLQSNGDPRLAQTYVPGSGGQKAMVQGTFSTPSTTLVPNTVSRALIRPADPVYFISEAESYFLQAEAALRGFGQGNPEALYEAGVLASFSQLGLEDQAASLLAPTGPYAFPEASSLEEKLEAIIVQKWVALSGTKQGIEAFFERNRTGYPQTSAVAATNPNYVPGQFTFPVEAVTNPGQFAKRLIFPDIERTRNENTPPEEPVTKEVWWDVR
jgi:hypothetical protein